jgi:hypothetical protein
MRALGLGLGLGTDRCGAVLVADRRTMRLGPHEECNYRIYLNLTKFIVNIINIYISK